ncbi:MAG: hypothetical protein AB1816_02245 [Bacillota bacterium]
MRVVQWMRLFKQYRDKHLFSLSDLIQMTGEKRQSLLVQLSRLEKAGLVERAARGWYLNPFNPATPEEVATAIRFPSYLSLEYALARHSVLSQFPYTLTLVTTRLPCILDTDRTRFEYHQVSRRLFWGYRPLAGTPVAEPEKALLDLVYIRHVRSRELSAERLESLFDDMYLEELDLGKLAAYARRFGTATERALAAALGAFGLSLPASSPTPTG